ncbi:28S ribosomal protein S18a, mitochondrial [Dirofilaria immitis]|nr:28S ribosomal protein S18a, mitochondrial [Dirofilaria immitis]
MSFLLALHKAVSRVTDDSVKNDGIRMLCMLKPYNMLAGCSGQIFCWPRQFATTFAVFKKKIDMKLDGDTTIVEVVDVPDVDNRKLLEHSPKLAHCALVRYSDVLILEQFMREDGSVLPQALTGLCKKQQQRIERCVMQAHWAGLFPDRTIADFDRSGYKRFARYWNDDIDIYRMKEDVIPGSWYYIKRYNTRGISLKKN